MLRWRETMIEEATLLLTDVVRETAHPVVGEIED
jgi:hypothetical protein